MGRPLLIYGAGGSGREIATWAREARWQGQGFSLLGFVDDAQPRPGRVHDLDVMSLTEAAERHPGASIVVAVGGSRLRARLVAAAEAAGLASAPPLIHPRAELDRDRIVLGDGVVICPGSVVTTDIVIGVHTMINVNCTITHDTWIGPYVTLSPGVQLSGTNRIEAHAFLGTGAVTVNGIPGRPLRIGEGARIGAGAVVTRDIPAGVLAVGVPARVVSET